MLSLERNARAHLGRRGRQLLAEHAALSRGLATDDPDRFEQSLSGLQRHHQQIEDRGQFVQDSQLTLASQTLDDIAGQQPADHGAAQKGRNPPSRIKVRDHQARHNYQHQGGDARRAIDRHLLHLVEAGPGQCDVGLPDLGRVLIGVGGFRDPPSEQLPRDAIPLKR
jgi:hypothetical protein